MATNSTIEWTEATWNPLTGCTKISPGCKYCYAERMAKRLMAMGQSNYVNGFKLTLQEQALELPLKWKKPRTVFVNSMSDLFHKNVPTDYIERVFKVMNAAHWHQFQVLTKRSERLLEVSHRLNWTPNIWMGVSVENLDYTFRIDHLRQTDAQVKFLSLEPLLGALPKLNLKKIDWVIVGRRKQLWLYYIVVVFALPNQNSLVLHLVLTRHQQSPNQFFSDLVWVMDLIMAQVKEI